MQLSLDRLEAEINNIASARADGYDSRYAMVYLPFDQQSVNKIKSLVQSKKDLHPSMIIVIGIGGSNLGAMAADKGLNMPGCIPIYYADTVDPDMLAPLLELTESTLKSGNQILINIVSKSGTTTETIINASLFVELLTRYYPHDYDKFVVVTTEKDNELWKLATEQHFVTIEVPSMVGGRFSVLSGVGLFPLALSGIDIDQLLVGARQMTDTCLKNGADNYAAISATILFESYKKGFVIHDFFPFSLDMKALGLWYRQLLAESIGKELSVTGSRVNVGITPTISVGSTDLHSMVELHLGGPHNTLTTFVDIHQRRSELIIPKESVFSSLMSYAAGKNMANVLDAIMKGAQRTYKERKLPFMTVTFPEKSSLYYGQFFQWKILETIYLGYLFGINPFEQPLVELCKNETRAILSHE